MQFDHIAQQVPDVPAALAWLRATVPGCEVQYQDETWALVEAAGVRIALVRPEQHPGHLAWRVSAAELKALARRFDQPIKSHRDGSESFYVTGPGEMTIEIIAFPSP